VVRWLEDSVQPIQPGGQLCSEFGKVLNLKGVDSGHSDFFDTIMQSFMCQLKLGCGHYF